MQASVGAVEIPSGATSPGGLAAGIGGYARQNSAAASPLNAVGVYGQGSTTVSNAAGSLWGGNFLVSNGPHSDGDTTGFSLAAMWGVESNVNVKSTNSGSPIWPNGLGVFGFQAVGASTAQVGDGGGGGEALAFSVRPLGITTTPVKAWQVGLDTSNGSAAVGVQLGAKLRSAGNVNLEVTETAAGGGTLNLIAANDALSTAIPFALIYSTGSIGAFTSTTTLNGTYNLGGIVNGGVATKYVCVDASSNIVVQVAAC